MYNINLAQSSICWLLHRVLLFTSMLSCVNCSRDILSWYGHMRLFLAEYFLFLQCLLPNLKPIDFNSGFGSTAAEKLLKLLCTQLLGTSMVWNRDLTRSSFKRCKTRCQKRDFNHAFNWVKKVKSNSFREVIIPLPEFISVITPCLLYQHVLNAFICLNMVMIILKPIYS